jgi:transcriptional regulator with XRE-family HTH domain
MNARLQNLREALKMEWGELATHLGISRSMLDFVRKGQRNLSFPAIRRLEAVEKEAGILPQIQLYPDHKTSATMARDAPIKNLKILEKGDAKGPTFESIMAKLDAVQAELDELRKRVGMK